MRRAVEVVGDAGALGFHAMLAEGHPQLEREQLVELEPLPRRPERRLVGREVDVAQGAVVGAEALGVDDLLGQRVVDRAEPFERPVQQLPDRAGGDAFGRRMHRGDPPGVHQVGLVAAQDLDLLLRELQPSPV